MAFVTSTVAGGDDALASQYNNLRLDAIENAGDYNTSGGSSSAYTLSIDSEVTAYAEKQVFKFKANHTNTGASTLNVNSIGAKSIKSPDGSDMEGGSIVSGGVYAVIYDGTNLQLYTNTPQPKKTLSAGSGTPSFMSTFYRQTDDGDIIVGISGTTLQVWNSTTKTTKSRTTISDWSAVVNIRGVMIMGDYLYAVLTDTSPAEVRVYRYNVADVSTGGIQMTATFGSINTNLYTSGDGTDLFFTSDGFGTRFGDATTQFDVTNPSGDTWRYTYDGTGTAPLFVTNGLLTGTVLDISGFANISNNRKLKVTSVTETYFEVDNGQGDEMVQNGGFASSAGWSFQAGWVFDGVNNEIDATSTLNYTSQSIDFTVGETYDTSYDILNYSAGSMALRIGGVFGTTRSANGTYVEQVVHSGSDILYIDGITSAFTGSVDNVSVKLAAGGVVESNKTNVTIDSNLDYNIARYTISGTTLTKAEVIACGETSGYFDGLGVDGTYIYAEDGASPYQRKFDKTGVLQATADFGFSNIKTFFNLNGEILVHDTTNDVLLKVAI